MGKKTLIIIVYTTLLTPFVSCKQSCFDVLTHNDVGYWSFNNCSFVEFSKKDSTMKYLDMNWAYVDFDPALWGLKFRIVNDTLFSYVNRKGLVDTYEPLLIVSYSKNTFISNDCEAENVKWHRISTRYARRMMKSQVKLSSLLTKRDHNRSISDIDGIVWKLYGYGDVSTGIVRKSESLKRDWMNIIKFWGNGRMSGQSIYNKLCGEYTISGSNIDFLSFDKGELGEDFDGDKFCNILPQCKKFVITNDWLQLFYNEGKSYMIFKVAESFMNDHRTAFYLDKSRGQNSVLMREKAR